VKVEIRRSVNRRRQVVVGEVMVGEIQLVRPELVWRDYNGTLRAGVRWLPVGVDPQIDGPFTPEDAALLLLALNGYDERKAIKALYGRVA